MANTIDKAHWVTFGENIKFLRNYHRQTQIKLALDIGLSQAMINNYEKGRSTSVDTLYLLALYYGVSMDTLLEVKLCTQNIMDHCKWDGSTSKLMRNITKRQVVEKRYSELVLYSYYFSTEIDADNPYLREGTMMIGDFRNPNYIDVISEMSGNSYTGKLLVSEEYLNIYLSCETRNERAMIVLPAYESHKRYIGGLGLCVSLSTGNKKRPCAQYIIFSAVKIRTSMFPRLEKMLSFANQNKSIALKKKADYEVYKMIESILTENYPR